MGGGAQVKPRTPEQDRIYLKAYRAANLEKVRAQARARMKKWQASHPEQVRAKNEANWAKNRDRLIAKQRERYKTDHDKALASALAWRRNNREKSRAASKAWVASHPNNKRAIDAKRRARRAGLIAETIDIGVLAARQNSMCTWCGRVMAPSEFTLDHIIPIAVGAEGGASHTYGNLQLLHRSCNSAKGARVGLPV
jgi:5-methylcytosine-specific restriction endonuclease McrA